MIDAHPDLAGFRKGNLSQGLWDERIITHNERDFLVGNECVRGLNVGERVYREYTQNRVRGTVLGSEGGLQSNLPYACQDMPGYFPRQISRLRLSLKPALVL